MDDITLRRLQNTELEILRYVHKICVENDIHYYIVGGTLLGAVRHQGFIPWDDDCDIAMPRKDYEKFIQLCQEGALGDRFFLHCISTDDTYMYFFAKVRKNHTFFDEKQFKSLSCHKGIFIDIFPLDYCRKPHGPVFHLRAGIVKLISKIIMLRVFNYKSKNIFMRIVRWTAGFFSIKQLSAARDGIASFCRRGDYYINYGSFYSYKKQTMKRSVYEPAQTVMFEQERFYAPCCHTQFLESLYGDWEKLPPEEKRRNHNASTVIFDTREGCSNEDCIRGKEEAKDE